VNKREREQYLREYSILKGQGKPFFPYAVAKDGVMASITIGVIIVMAILFGAELGPKADPTTTTYTPRPEWYFFFLFELLRVVKPPELVFLATVGIPTLCLVLLLLLPFFDRGPERHPLRRPIATTSTSSTSMACMSMATTVPSPSAARTRSASTGLSSCFSRAVSSTRSWLPSTSLNRRKTGRRRTMTIPSSSA
jgi:menaquinol-cytochrome c reductase cytochrome b/c subunit